MDKNSPWFTPRLAPPNRACRADRRRRASARGAPFGGADFHAAPRAPCPGTGLRYTRFHTTALLFADAGRRCSRGRNHHSAGSGLHYRAGATAIPVTQAKIPRSLRPWSQRFSGQNGYSTAFIGKKPQHPRLGDQRFGDRSTAGPCLQGFDHFYGFIGRRDEPSGFPALHDRQSARRDGSPPRERGRLHGSMFHLADKAHRLHPASRSR